ncbi:4'-phosphopantetheinyl transferase superfamily protein [Priestia filamentosa]|uniref:4'-phosphopantetheinyl transferase family protein n=1 Tax=Priestia filamentosa TaxID=1402861 RepID=UPI001FB1B49B|nr:4'-phosphopantetheinyl transferase superfamily protein [Priestia filamentosa]UOE58255.1 4'-phosphopantetheinyl transferase superfamily protein [Priestia filamentosa]
MKIYAVKIPKNIKREDSSILLNYVSPPKKEAIYNAVKSGRYEPLLSDLIIKTLINEIYKIKSNDIQFTYNKYGKPFLRDIEISYNISHSYDWLVCVIDKSSVGIDIEKIRPLNLNIAKRFFSNEEFCEIISRDKVMQLDYFFELWTLKESFLKFLGTGMYTSLNSFTIKKHKSRYTILSRDKLLSNSNCYFKTYILDKKYKMAVCAANEIFPNKIDIRTLSHIKESLASSQEELGDNLKY